MAKTKKSTAIPSLFDEAMKASIMERLEVLRPDARRQWGTMEVAQMLRHCAIPFEIPLGRSRRKRSFIGYVFGRFVKKMVTDPKPFKHNLPTDKTFVVQDMPSFEAEKKKLIEIIEAFCSAPKEKIDKAIHPFFGRLTARQWGTSMWKHLDHHLRQFGV
jgi:hypothetical protein